MIKTFIHYLGLILILSFLPKSTFADCIEANTNTKINTVAGLSSGSNYKSEGQSFNACETGEITSISIEIDQVNAAGDFFILLNAGTPDLVAPDYSQSFTVSSGETGTKTITLATPFNVTMNTLYSFMIVPDGASGQQIRLQSSQESETPYLGNRYNRVSALPHASVNTVAAWDLTFSATISLPPPTPIPALGEWGVFLLFVTITILGIVGFMNTNAQVAFSTTQRSISLSSHVRLPFDSKGIASALKITLMIVPVAFVFIYLSWGEIVIDDFIGISVAIPLVSYLIYLMKIKH